MLPYNSQPPNRSNRARRRAVVSLGLLAIGFIAVSQLTSSPFARKPSRTESTPHFALDLDSASQAELRLLPSVGEKTARSWIESRSQPTYTTPTSEADLEALPHVGPNRARQLAPHLLETNR
jgi:DNA uptake protein ComE-like DNA-binding protein